MPMPSKEKWFPLWVKAVERTLFDKEKIAEISKDIPCLVVDYGDWGKVFCHLTAEGEFKVSQEAPVGVDCKPTIKVKPEDMYSICTGETAMMSAMMGGLMAVEGIQMMKLTPILPLFGPVFEEMGKVCNE